MAYKYKTCRILQKLNETHRKKSRKELKIKQKTSKTQAKNSNSLGLLGEKSLP